MRYLKVGMQGTDVMAWETFLKGRPGCGDFYIDGIFDYDTERETKRFQAEVGFTGQDVDGVVGNLTLAKAASLGFRLASDDSSDETGPDWPAQPANVKPLNSIDREKLFGKFAFVAAPVAGNQEAIKITDNWARDNIVTVVIPQLKGIEGAPGSCKVQFHAKGAKQLQDLFAAWEAAGLLPLVLGWAGSWVPRFIRGSKTNLSNHAWGTAFDINVPWNMLGVVPALKGKKGSVRELVDLAVQHGFFWGGWFSGRPDGMHFELREIL